MVKKPKKKKPKKKYLLRKLPQRGTSNRAIDALIKAKLPGKRVSKTGKIYWETRRSRSDEVGKKV